MAVQARTKQTRRKRRIDRETRYGLRREYKVQYAGWQKSYAKRGFLTKKEATQHEAEMRTKLQSPVYSPVNTSHGKQGKGVHLSVSARMTMAVHNHSCGLIG